MAAPTAVVASRWEHLLAWLDSPESEPVVRRVFWLLFGLALGFLLSWAVTA